MWAAWLGFIFFAAMTLMGFTGALAHFFLYDAHVPDFMIPTVKLGMACLIAPLVVAIFFHQSGLASRLPRPIPGRLLVIIGAILWIGVPALVTFEMTYVGTHYLGILAQYGLATFPAYLCFLFACGRMLLVAGPRS
ncbi:MAG: hypothetical protein JSS58_10215 [Proteobacteria bacterium]|nr:hypothetical protein [Pseudomonadota bacterium]